MSKLRNAKSSMVYFFKKITGAIFNTTYRYHNTLRNAKLTRIETFDDGHLYPRSVVESHFFRCKPVLLYLKTSGSLDKTAIGICNNFRTTPKWLLCDMNFFHDVDPHVVNDILDNHSRYRVRLHADINKSSSLVAYIGTSNYVTIQLKNR